MKLLCGLGIHRWRECKQAVWRSEFVALTLPLDACVTCGSIKRSSRRQLDELAPHSPFAFSIEDKA